MFLQATSLLVMLCSALMLSCCLLLRFAHTGRQQRKAQPHYASAAHGHGVQRGGSHQGGFAAAPVYQRIGGGGGGGPGEGSPHSTSSRDY